MARETGARVQATITSVDPLEILVDGATVPCPAASVDLEEDAAPLGVGDRCYAEDRAPRRPLVTGVIRLPEEEPEEEV